MGPSLVLIQWFLIGVVAAQVDPTINPWLFAAVGLLHAVADGFALHNRIRDVARKLDVVAKRAGLSLYERRRLLDEWKADHANAANP